jgi:hypothetical protein
MYLRHVEVRRSGKEETEMNGNYTFLCGVMWCKFGQQEAGKELLRAAKSKDPDMSALAWAMFEKGARRLNALERRGQISSRTILETSLSG